MLHFMPGIAAVALNISFNSCNNLNIGDILISKMKNLVIMKIN